jgi:chemotaxis signal transduction protein
VADALAARRPQPTQDGAEVSDADVAVLRARARALAAPVAAAGHVDVAQVVVLTVGDRRFALAAAAVREVLPPAPTTRLPRRGHELAGARPLRGDLLALADPGRAAGGGDLVAQPDACFVAVLDGPEPLGLLAHAATTAVPLGDLATVGGAGVVRGVTADGVVLLDAEAILSDPRFRVARPER